MWEFYTRIARKAISKYWNILLLLAYNDNIYLERRFNIPAFLSDISSSRIINSLVTVEDFKINAETKLDFPDRRIRENVRSVSLELGTFPAPIITRSQPRNNRAHSERRFSRRSRSIVHRVPRYGIAWNIRMRILARAF